MAGPRGAVVAPVTTYRAVFGIREFRALFVARLFTMTAVVLSSLALGTVMFRETGSPFLTAVSSSAGRSSNW